MDQGIYFEQKKYPAGRGYAYVAINGFRTRAGCRLNGNLRRSDFLPVGEETTTTTTITFVPSVRT